ncbi:30S ribosomal protein S16 [Candidatus Uhrbacteria bacterium]|nr:30S ribosomal protein S16 [Candidatus Uhrbacteria bacterium]
MIRLARRGKKNKSFFRVYIAEKTKDAFGTSLEELGWYDPSSTSKQAELHADRIRYWLSKGAQASPTVHNLLIAKKIIESPKIKVYSPKKKKEKK